MGLGDRKSCSRLAKPLIITIVTHLSSHPYISMSIQAGLLPEAVSLFNSSPAAEKFI